jgi:hypothetical protein
MYRYFTYSAYWGTWSRVILPYTHKDGVIELNLTPVNPDWERSWDEQVRPIIFRRHGTALGLRDKWTDVLPEEVAAIMSERIGPELTIRLLQHDWLKHLDIEKVKRGRDGGGGLPFAECCRSPQDLRAA